MSPRVHKRRGEGIVAEPSSPATTPAAEAPVPPAPGLLAFVVRILEQLSLSAWFPGALLSASMALLWTFRTQDEGIDLPSALGTLTEDAVAALLLTIPILMLATAITQAFSYAAIRILEGYWYGQGPVAVARRIMIQRHVRIRTDMDQRRDARTLNAFMAVEDDMIQAEVSDRVRQAWRAQIEGNTVDRSSFDENDHLNFAYGWRRFADAWRLAEIDDLRTRRTEYPEPHRILPTQLGNVLRSTEDVLELGEEGLEGYVAAHRHLMPLNTRVQHDQFRTRLDMYSIMVFVCAFLVALTPVLLWGDVDDREHVLLIMTIFTALTLSSYRAAVFSAQGYCSVLREIDRRVRKEKAEASSTSG